MNNQAELVNSKVGTEAIPPQRNIIVFDLASRKYVEIMMRLAKYKNWKPVHWFGSLPDDSNKICGQYPQVKYYSKSDVVRLRLPDTVPYIKWPRRDIDVIKKLAVYDPVLYPVFLREAQRPYGMDQIAEYHEVITTWFYFFEHANPDLVVFGQMPAHIYDYLPYLLCQERGIPTLLLLKHHHVPGVIMPTNSYEEPPPRIAARYKQLIDTNSYLDIKLIGEWQQYLDKMSGTYEKAMYKDFNRRYLLDHKKDRIKLRDTIYRKLFDVITGKRSIFYARALAREVLTLHRRWLLRWSYESKTIQPDYNTPYIFVPLHVQPERTSVPQGDIFGHQLLMIEILSRSLPEGWLLYVKEHPVQLYDRPVFKFFRTPVFYKEILRFKNVRLVPSRITARKLIDHARAVAAVTSTTCWEALFRGKPALIFGHVWFKFCEGVFHTPTDDKCREAMDKISKGYSIDPDKLKACLYAIQEEGVARPKLNVDKNNPETRKQLFDTWSKLVSDQLSPDGIVITKDTVDTQKSEDKQFIPLHSLSS